MERIHNTEYHGETNPHFGTRPDDDEAQHHETNYHFTLPPIIREEEAQPQPPPRRLSPRHHHEKPVAPRHPDLGAKEAELFSTSTGQLQEPTPHNFKLPDQDGSTITSQPRGLRFQPQSLTISNTQIVVSVLCSIFWVLVLLLGLVILVLYTIFHPLSPRFGVSTGSLNLLSLDKNNTLSVNLTFTANFTNPNKQASFGFKYVVVELYFGRTLLDTQNIEPFSVRKAQTRYKELHSVATQVQLYKLDVARLQRLTKNGTVVFEVKGNFLAHSNLLRNSFWLHGICTIRLRKPPHGDLVSSNCNTKH